MFSIMSTHKKILMPTIIIWKIIFLLIYLGSSQVWSQGISFKGRELFHLLAQYQGEELIQNPQQKVVHYFTATEQAQHRVYIQHGRLVDAQGRALDPQLKRFPKRSGTAIYVMDKYGRIYYSFDHSYGRIHHSSLVAGQAVASAGEMLIYEGIIYSISNKSGHYHPSAVALKRVIEQLKKQQVPIHGIDLFIINKKGKSEAITWQGLQKKT